MSTQKRPCHFCPAGKWHEEHLLVTALIGTDQVRVCQSHIYLVPKKDIVKKPVARPAATQSSLF